MVRAETNHIMPVQTSQRKQILRKYRRFPSSVSCLIGVKAYRWQTRFSHLTPSVFQRQSWKRHLLNAMVCHAKERDMYRPSRRVFLRSQRHLNFFSTFDLGQVILNYPWYHKHADPAMIKRDITREIEKADQYWSLCCNCNLIKHWESQLALWITTENSTTNQKASALKLSPSVHIYFH